MYILGINAYHGGASACLIKDGQLDRGGGGRAVQTHKVLCRFPGRGYPLCAD